MKTYFYNFLFCTLILILISSDISIAGLISGDYSMSKAGKLFREDKANTTIGGRNYSNSDSLPAGVTKEWMNNIRDENGNKIIPEDEGDAMQRKIFNGMNAGEHFGCSISTAGDVNNDGYDDIIIGAYFYNGFTGRVCIFYGGLNMNTVADITITGEALGNFFGESVSAAGDVNGDGYADVVVGASGYSSSTGRAYIYFGGASMNNIADVIMTGEASSNYFGASVSKAGDVNGDGYSDVIIGAYEYSSYTGRAYIYFGGASMNSTADVTMTGEASGNNFGILVSTTGDVNGDGFADVIIGASGYNGSTGKAYIYFGGASMNNTADVTMAGEAVNNYFGKSASTAGDVNGDGYDDVIIGANGYSTSTGRAYIYYGGASMNNASDVTITGEATNNFFGKSVSTAGDVNGDGYSDVIVGAYGYSNFTGRTYIYFGGVSMNNTIDAILTGESTSSAFGYSVSTAGDVNGDGYSDIIVGAYNYASNVGRVYLYDYFMKGEIVSDIAVTGDTTNNYFGFSVSEAGDVNSDGYADIIVGAYGNNSSTGKAYIFFGGISMNDTADVTMIGEAVSNYFGCSVSTAGDVNGDGYADVIVGAYGYNSNIGRAYIFYGGMTMNNIADLVLTGGSTSFFASSVSTAGDVNGDGYTDVIVGAYAYSSNTGRAYIYYGGASMNNASDVTITGEAANNFFGKSVSTAGDVNGDGYSDVIVGAYGYSSYTGRTYIYFGGTSMNNTADLVITGEATNILFGYSVSEAGDVNGDGHSDVIVGAYGSSAYTGKAYIFFGGTSMNTTADVTMTGEVTNDYFGISVSTAGDVNADGYSDVIVGAYAYSITTGRAYIYLGGSSMNNISDVTMNGETTGNYFGTSVSTAGDVNGDGFSDVINGANGYSSNTGKAYTYFGSAISAKPILNYVKDVPNDQGGYVYLKWARSSFDVIGNNTITDYYLEMSYPPTGGNFAWIPSGIISAVKNSFYSYNVSTPFDSSSAATGNFYFRVTARTSDPSVFWRSNILYGRSIDNIAPLMVSPFTAVSEASNVRLNWKRSNAPDLMNYILFRSTSPTIDPYTETPFATLGDSTYLDTSPLSGLYYYFIVAQDIHNNLSPVAVAESPNITVNATMFIEGFYNAGANSQVNDTITAYLRNNLYPYSIADQSMAVVSSNGSVTLKFGNASSGTYYLVLTHRNSIETWSANGISVTRGGSVNYDFSNSSSQAFGNNMKQVDTSPVRFAIFSGDVNQDGVVEATDAGAIDNDASNFVSGYVNTDITGDDLVDATDAAIGENNAANFVAKVVP